MLDFTSALYLGLRHPSSSLRPWPSLTIGKPAALAAPPGAAATAHQLAVLQGCEHATLAPSTLHLFLDLFAVLARNRVRIYMDAGSYAIARWGVERVAARGVPVHPFAHLDHVAVKAMIERDRHSGRRPLIVTDGFCPTCGRPAPLAEYLRCVEAHHGQLVIDDTQSLGILGERPSAAEPYGKGGGGSLRWQGIRSPHVIMGSSLAKGFGVPVAVLSASKTTIRRFENHADTRVHSSPPSVAVIRAAEHALGINRMFGGKLRSDLAQLVQRFRDRLGDIGLTSGGGMFPVQTLQMRSGAVKAVHARLRQSGIRTVMIRRCRGVGAQLAFLITAAHRPADIDRAVAALARAIESDRAPAPMVRAS